MNITFTDLQLQIALAKALRNIISMCDCGLIHCDQLTWTHTGLKVTLQEWDWAVREVIRGLLHEQFVRFVKALDNGTNKPQTLTWQQRATALVEIGVITVE